MMMMSHIGHFRLCQDVDQYLALDDRKDAEVMSVRLENIKLTNKLKKQEAQLKSKVHALLVSQ